MSRASAGDAGGSSGGHDAAPASAGDVGGARGRDVTLRRQVLAWAAQRASAVLLGLCVVIHLGINIVAVRHGLSAAEILGRTRDSLAWAGFYGLFVIAVAVHAPLGLRVIIAEWLGWRGRPAAIALAALGVALMAAGLLALAGLVR